MKIKWKKLILTLGTSGLLCGTIYHVMAEPDQLIAYQAEIEPGDTIWDVCSRIASDKDNMEELVFRTAKENNIKDPGALQPGDKLIVRVKALRGDK